MVIDTLRSGGKERRMIELVKGLIDKRVEVSVLVLSNLIEYNEIYDLPIRLLTLERRVKWDISLYPKINRVIQSFRPDIIQVWETMVSFYVAPLSKLSNAKLVSSIIADAPQKLNLYSKKGLLSRFSFLFSDLIIGNSKAGIKAYKAPQKKTHCVYNGIDFNRLYNIRPPQSIRNEYNISENQIIITMVASFSDYKDYATYIRAASLLLKKYKNLAFWCIGDGPNLPAMKQLARKLNINIKFMGRVSKVEPLINASDIGVLSTYTEGLSNAIIEFMVMGKPVVATDGGGTKELIRDHETGFLVNEGSKEDLADKIEQLINDPQLRKLMGERGRVRITEEFNLNIMTERYYSLFLNLLGDA